MVESEVGSFELKDVLGVFGWIGNVESAVFGVGVEVFEAGEVVEPVALMEDQVDA